MRLEEFEPDLCKNEQEFSISGLDTIELIKFAFAKDALFRFKVKGFSMSPFIRDGDIVKLSPVSHYPISFGRSVACVCPAHNRLMIHRVISKKKEHYLIKGDNCFAPDGLMSKEDILGCVIGIERKNKPVFFGLGPERIIIAFLSRKGLLLLVKQLIPESLRKLIKCRMLL